MTRNPPRFNPTKNDYVDFTGGFDTETPPLKLRSGALRTSQNWECAINGGYSRTTGYERFDGQAKPSDASYSVISITLTGSIAVGATVTGGSSGATGVVIAVPTGQVVITKIVGTFFYGETLNVVGPQATTTSPAIPGAGGTPKLHAQYLNLAADVYRADIDAVPGSGSVLGVAQFNDVVYAFRNNLIGSNAAMWRSSAAGWVAVSLPISLLPGGRYEFDIKNLTGTGKRVYGVDGKNKGFEFDGTTYVPITTGMVVDTPTHVAVHKNHLFFSFGPSAQHSGIGQPFSWTLLTGAAELNMGDDITGFSPQPGSEAGGAMVVFCRNRINVLYGNSAADWQLTNYADEQGAIEHTVQRMSQTLMLDDRGLTSLVAAQTFGNFRDATLTQHIQKWLNEKRLLAKASCIVRDKSQYRLFFSDKYALYVTIKAQKLIGVSSMLLVDDVKCIHSGELSDGSEVIFFGSSDGVVYQMERGTSFDGDPIDHFMFLAFNHSKSPRLRKRYKHGMLEVQGDGYAEFDVSAELGYNTELIGQPGSRSLAVSFGSVFWDSFVWDNFTWDGKTLSPSDFGLEGTAENISIVIRGLSDYQSAITLSGMLLDLSERRRNR